MDRQLESASGRVRSRRSLRRAVHLEADVMSELWDGGVPLTLTNLSLHGAWLDSDLALSVGDEVSLTFTPPRWQSLGLPSLRARATVARVSLRRRRCDAASAGMGLCFSGLSPVTACCLDSVLRGLPPPLPALPSAEVEQHHPARIRLADDPARIDFDDGSSCELRAEAPLLSWSRPRARSRMLPLLAAALDAAASNSIGSYLLAASERACANEAGASVASRLVGSPMTAIFRGSRPRRARAAS